MRLGAVAVVAVLGSVAPASNAYADVRLEFPTQEPGIPAYARIQPQWAIEDGEWAAIPFYRDPSCVPPDFNLLAFFDVPGAFSCPLTVEGFDIWEHGPGADPAPIMSSTNGATTVPVWFFSWPQLQAAMGDGVLTRTELEGLSSRVVGYADRYHETLRPGRMIALTASGTLSDGTPFRFHLAGTVVKGQPVVHNVSITFG